MLDLPIHRYRYRLVLELYRTLVLVGLALGGWGLLNLIPLAGIVAGAAIADGGSMAITGGTVSGFDWPASGFERTRENSAPPLHRDAHLWRGRVRIGRDPARGDRCDDPRHHAYLLGRNRSWPHLRRAARSRDRRRYRTANVS